MSGTIGFTNLKVSCVIGVYRLERLKKQTLFVDVALTLPKESWAKNDLLSETVDYAEMAKKISRLAVLRKFKLLETFAREALVLIFKDCPQVSRAKISIRKPRAIPGADCAVVSFETDRE